MVCSFSITLNLSASSASFLACSRVAVSPSCTRFSTVRSSSRLASSNSRCLRSRSACTFCASANFSSRCLRISCSSMSSFDFCSRSWASANLAFLDSSAAIRVRSTFSFSATCSSSDSWALTNSASRSRMPASRLADSVSFCASRRS